MAQKVGLGAVETTDIVRFLASSMDRLFKLHFRSSSRSDRPDFRRDIDLSREDPCGSGHPGPRQRVDPPADWSSDRIHHYASAG